MSDNIYDLPEVPVKKNNKTLWIILAVVAAVLLCCCVVVLVVSLFVIPDQADQFFYNLTPLLHRV